MKLINIKSLYYKTIIIIILIAFSIYISTRYKVKISNIEFYENKSKPYTRYSSVNGKCIKTTKYLGNNILDIPITGYQTKAECLANNDICQQYSNDKNKCIKQTNCGYCTNDKNQGMCLSGTPSGPINLKYKCQQSGHKSNDFTMGHPDEYIPPVIPVNKYPFTLPHPDIAPDYNLIPMV